jgi:hypothetical protein
MSSGLTPRREGAKVAKEKRKKSKSGKAASQ